MTPTQRAPVLPAPYRKKPVVITASQWFKHGDHPAVTDPTDVAKQPEQGWCRTLEGGHIVTPGDWIITGVKGEHYPCKPDIFEATYEAASKEPPVSPDEPVARVLRDGATVRLEWASVEAAHNAKPGPLYARAALPAGWKPIETAPRDSSRVLVASYSANIGEWRIHEAWWRMPYESAPSDHCWWCYDGSGTLLDKSIHGLGASHWMPLPAAPDVHDGAER